MENDPATPHQFILEVFDRERWCPVLQSMLEVWNLESLQTILGEESADDPDLEHVYTLDSKDLSKISDEFGVSPDIKSLGLTDIEITIFKREHVLSRLPYLCHTGYELPLMLEGRKKMAKMYHAYPPMNFPGEDRFDRWVAEGKLHKEVVIQPFDPPIRNFEGHRVAYYTLKGEEWRIPASKLIWKALEVGEGWNEHFERLEGMLFGYEDWQNDWWIEQGLKNGGFSGLRLCCAVNAAELAWVETAGFRALPPIDSSSLAIVCQEWRHAAEMKEFMHNCINSVALLRFNLYAKVLMNILDIRKKGPWYIPRDRIPELNRNLLRPIVVLWRQEDCQTAELHAGPLQCDDRP